MVVATVFPLADWARHVGGDRVFVKTLLPAGASPHTFDPAPADMRIIAKSKVFLKVGLHMDDWGAGMMRSAGKNGPVMVSIGDLLLKQGKLPEVSALDPPAQEVEEHGPGDHDHEHEHGIENPHFWLDPHLAIESVGIIRDALISADPAGKEIYQANAQKYLDQLRALDVAISLKLTPIAGKAFVSFHNAWPYLAARYHLRVAAVIEEYAGKTPSEKYLRTITDRLKAEGIVTIFTEPQLNPHVAELIAAAVGGSVRMLDPYGTEGSPDRGSYISMMEFNTDQIRAALATEKITTTSKQAAKGKK